MLRLAARAREARLAPIVAAGFLNYSRPRFDDVLASCIAAGADAITIQPYFLAPGAFVGTDLPHAIATAQQTYPHVIFAQAPPFGDHPALATLIHKRVCAAVGNTPLTSADTLVLIAHGSTTPNANQPFNTVAHRLQTTIASPVRTGYLTLNEPRLADLLAQHDIQNSTRIIVVPYFLQLGGHVAEDLPRIIETARQRTPSVPIILTEHLAYDPLLLTIIADRSTNAHIG